MIAAGRGHLEVVETLIEAGAQTDLTDQQGKTARVLALEAGSPALAKLLAAASTAKP